MFIKIIVKYVYQVFWLKAQKIQSLIALSLVLKGGSSLSVVNVQKVRNSNEDFQNICKIFVANVQMSLCELIMRFYNNNFYL